MLQRHPVGLDLGWGLGLAVASLATLPTHTHTFRLRLGGLGFRVGNGVGKALKKQHSSNTCVSMFQRHPFGLELGRGFGRYAPACAPTPVSDGPARRDALNVTAHCKCHAK